MTTTSEPAESFQLTLAMAERYEEAFVPAFFAQWAPVLCDAAGVAPGQRVLDVACGTGIVTRTAADRAMPAGTAVGVDVNPAMLTVAAGCALTSSSVRAKRRRSRSTTPSSTWCCRRWR